MGAPCSKDPGSPMRAASFCKAILSPFIEFIYPAVCLGCRLPLSTNEQIVCARCWETIRPVHEADEEFREMAERLSASGYIDGLVACYLFEKDGVLQSLIHELKYGGMSAIGAHLGEHLGARVLHVTQGESVAGLIPVPLHPVKKRERGYNQSECICRGIARVTGLPVFSSMLRRTKYTKTQTQLTVMERERNVKDAFAVSGQLAGTVILVDDVITTGATINASARALAAHGAKRIYACSIALACKAELP